MNNVVKEMIQKSGLSFLERMEFEEVTPGRFFQKKKIDLATGLKLYYVILGPNMESPVHNHRTENMNETHLLQYGSGKFLIYNGNGSVERQLELQLGRFHTEFSTKKSSPDHKYVAGPQGSILSALEKYHT